MKKFILIIFFCLLFFVLVACTEKTPKDLVRGTEGFVTMVDDNRLLIGDVLYEVTHETELVNSENKKMSFKDFQIGTFVIPFYNGSVQESYPAQAIASKLELVQDTEPSQEVIAKIVTFVEEHIQKPVVFNEVVYDETKQVVTVTINAITQPGPIEIVYNYETDSVSILD